MNKIKEVYSKLNKLEELNKFKFNSSDFVSLNKDFELTLGEIAEQRKADVAKELSIDDKKNIFNLISKIEFLQSKICPKADLMSSFSKSIK